MQEVSHLVIKVSSNEVKTATAALDSMSRASDRLMGFIKGLVTAAAALAVFKEAASSIAEFEKQMSAIRAVTGATTEDMKALTLQARELGETTQFSAQQAAAGMKFLGQAGFSTKQILAAMPGLLDLATAGEMDLASASDIASAALAGFRLQASETNRVADALAVAAGETNTNVFQMGDALKYVAPIAASLNISLEDISAAIGILSNAGLQGSMAGTGLRQVLSSLAAPTREAIDTMRVYGIELEKVNPQTNSLTDILTHLRDRGLDAAGAFTLFGDRGAPAILALTNQIGNLEKLNTSLKNSGGRAKEMAGIIGDNLTGDFLKLKNATNELYLAVGEAGLGQALRDATQETTNFIRSINEMVKSGEAAAWLDLLKEKFMTLGGDAIENATANITMVWGMAMDYVSGTGKDAAEDIKKAFINMPENIRAAVQLTAITFENLWESLVNGGTLAVEKVTAFFNYLLATATNVGKEIWDQLSNPMSKGKFDYIKEQSAAFDKFSTASAAATAKANAASQAAADAWAEEVTNILNERDANISASDAKIKKIDELRAAYAKLKADRIAAENDKKPAGGTVPGATPDAGATHFDAQAFDRLRQELQLEEKTVQESYARRLDLIRKNTKEGSDLRIELETALNDRLEVEMDAANQAHFERLTNQYTAEQNALQLALDTKEISEQQFQERSTQAWNDYTASIQNISVTGSQNLANIQAGMMASVLGMGADVAAQMAQMAGEGTDAQKALFVVSKGIAIAQAIIMTNLASIAALAPPPIGLGPVAGLPYSTAIKALGYASAGLMAGATIAQVTKHEHGGMIGAGKFGIVGEAGQPELVRGPAVVTSGRQTADMGLLGASPKTTVIVNNNNGSEVSVTESRGPDGEKFIEVAVDRAVRRVASQIDQGAGEVSTALMRRTNLRRTG